MESVHVMLCITFCLEEFWFREALFQGAGAVGAVVYRFFVTIVTGNGTLFMQIHSTLNLVCIQSCDTGSQSGLARPRRLSGAARDEEVGQNGIQSNISTDTIHNTHLSDHCFHIPKHGTRTERKGAQTGSKAAECEHWAWNHFSSLAL